MKTCLALTDTPLANTTWYLAHRDFKYLHAFTITSGQDLLKLSLNNRHYIHELPLQGSRCICSAAL